MELADDKPEAEIKPAIAEPSVDTPAPPTSETEPAQTEAAADKGANEIDRTLLMFQNSHLFELD